MLVICVWIERLLNVKMKFVIIVCCKSGVLFIWLIIWFLSVILKIFDNIGILKFVFSWKNDKICCIIKERVVVMWNIVIILFNIENKIINLLIISNVWIEEIMVFLSNLLIGFFFCKCVLWRIKKGFWKWRFFVVCVLIL